MPPQHTHGADLSSNKRSQEGKTVEQGSEMGFIKFGSRVDVFLPLGTDIKVNIGDTVRGNRSVLAELTA